LVPLPHIDNPANMTNKGKSFPTLALALPDNDGTTQV